MIKTVAMMQPYFFPYLGYFQLISISDVFVLGDDLQYTKDGWINRNRFLQNGAPKLFTLPLKKDHHELNINQRQLAENAQQEITRLLKTLALNYARAPFCSEVLSLLERVMRYPQCNLSLYIEHSIREICAYLRITTPIINSSSLNLPCPRDKQDRVVQTMKKLGGTHYINPIGGLSLYCCNYFERHDLKLRFHRMNPAQYSQLRHPFVADLSIIDVLMFNSVDQIRQLLPKYSLETGIAHDVDVKSDSSRLATSSPVKVTQRSSPDLNAQGYATSGSWGKARPCS